MKRVLIVLSLIVLVLVCSCNPSTDTPSTGSASGYTVESNVDRIGSGRAASSSARSSYVVGEEIVGVLLQLNEVDPDTFYVEYLGDGEIQTNGDGMKYNYILYIPPYIQTAYENGGGFRPDTGNPFWWYMSVYFGLGMMEIRNDYEYALDLLLDRKGSLLPIPSASDVTGDWKSQYSSEDISSIVIPEQKDGELFFIRYDNHHDQPLTGTLGRIEIAWQSQGPFTNQGGSEYKDVIQYGFYLDENWTLFCPMELFDAFRVYDEWNGLTDKAFWKYMDTYFDISEMKAAGMNDHVTVINALIEAESLPIPVVEEYDKDDKEPKADGTFLAGYEKFFYQPGQIVSEIDISKVPYEATWKRVESQRENQDIQKYTWYDYCYFMLSEDGQTLYYPVALEYEYYLFRNGDYYGESGNPLWCYLERSCGGPSLDTLHKGDYSLGDIVGFINASHPFPFAEDYRDFAR